MRPVRPDEGDGMRAHVKVMAVALAVALLIPGSGFTQEHQGPPPFVQSVQENQAPPPASSSEHQGPSPSAAENNSPTPACNPEQQGTSLAAIEERQSPWPFQPQGRERVRTGLEVFLRDLPSELRGKRIGLITNPTGVDAEFRSNIDLLAARRDIQLVALFGPEHGVRGDSHGEVPHSIDAKTGLPVYSLFGPTKEPTPTMLSSLDALVFDVQDAGVRFYTYISTLALAMQQAAASGILFVVLDRPNPLGGQMVDGPVLDPQWNSFFGMFSLPILHGMTVGELAGLFNAEFGIGARLLVVRMEGWHRSMWFDDTGLPWVMPSPGIPHFQTAVLYPAMGPLGDTNLSVGGFTSKPFEFVGGTFVQPWQLRTALQARRLSGVTFREAYWQGEPWKPSGGPEYAGVEIRISDRSAYRPVDLTLQILDVVRSLYPMQFRWGPKSKTRYLFDLDMGTDQVRLALMAGKTPDQIEHEWQPDLDRFLQIRQKYLLYH